MTNRLFIGYPKCSTSRKAQTWLDEHGLDYTFQDIKKDHPDLDQITELYEKSGLPLKRFFNTSGQLYRSMNLKEKLPQMSEQEQLELLASDGMLVKRPILVDGDRVLVGFKPESYQGLIVPESN